MAREEEDRAPEHYGGLGWKPVNIRDGMFFIILYYILFLNDGISIFYKSGILCVLFSRDLVEFQDDVEG